MDSSIKSVYAVLPANLILDNMKGILRVAYMRIDKEELKSEEYTPDLTNMPDYIIDYKIYSDSDNDNNSDRVIFADIDNPISVLEHIIAMSNNGHSNDIYISIDRIFRNIPKDNIPKHDSKQLFLAPPVMPTNKGYNTTSNSNNDLTKCPICGTPLIYNEGCLHCPNCGWSACSG